MKSLEFSIGETDYRGLSQQANAQGITIETLVKRLIYEHQKNRIEQEKLTRKTVTQLKESIAKVAILPKTKNKKCE